MATRPLYMCRDLKIAIVENGNFLFYYYYTKNKNMITFYLSLLETEEDRKRFEKLYEENKQKLCFVARKVLRNEADVEDAVHTCFLNLAENFHKYREQSYVNLEKLCSVITKNAALDLVRRQSIEGSFSDIGTYVDDSLPDLSTDVLQDVLMQEKEDVLAKALRQLTEEERMLMYLRYGLLLKPKDIADIMHSSSMSIRKKTLNCRNKLATLLEVEGYGEDNE